ncbi:MAG: glycerol kinase GlpK [Eubacteriaceae bacterium]|nr:glycerol kinase GlpK [Eubacteriaceae bacterium]
MKYILALDEGTTSCRSVIYDENADPVSSAQKEFTQIYPKAAWVEHDPQEIWAAQLFTIKEALRQAFLSPGDICAIGITNQRETAVIWNRRTGKPLCNAIVWQCRRTAEYCGELSEDEGFKDYVQKTTGLLIDPYFSATKIKWVLDNVPGAREGAEAGEVVFGTIDSWLIYKLTGGKSHITDHTNASRTMLFDITKLKWDEKLLDKFEIPEKMLPETVESSGICAYTDREVFGEAVPIAGIAGDQQSSLFGQGCFEAGQAKNTYGTGCFLLMNTGTAPVFSKNSLVTTIAYRIRGKTYYALEGSVFVGGAVIQWLRDEMGLIENSAESEQCALKVEDTAGVHIVPAFTGLGAPHWASEARGIITGITRGANKNHIVRAALEAIAYQVYDLAECLQKDSGLRLPAINVDGGAAENNFLMQFQADIMGFPVNRPINTETTSLGAAFLAGLGAGIFPDMDFLGKLRRTGRVFEPKTERKKARELLEGWEKAVQRCLWRSE